ncbi:short-chain dehydrogenase-like protein [Podospora didyma]|uniref:Short-chain dehydrogenase-like protein n=1 Tax=Podospora didyma TaxID=330526 RepID=A0AAE0NQU3_9PEZI|nr:short-chain dehydrogenase-like protein [Podospora didyma]
MANYLITGTSRGLGLELVSQLLSRPASSVNLIFATTRSDPTPALQKLIDTSSGRLVNIQFDPVEITSVQAALPSIEKHLNCAGLDVLINNVGVMPYSPGGTSGATDLTSTFNANVLTAHNVTSTLLPLLERGKTKKIVNIGTTLGSMGMAERYAMFPVPGYKISKAALNMLTLQYALELGPKGYLVFGIAPGWVKTDLGSDQADLTVDVAVKAVLAKIDTVDQDGNGKLHVVLVKGWEKAPGLNQYDGSVAPW